MYQTRRVSRRRLLTHMGGGLAAGGLALPSFASLSLAQDRSVQKGLTFFRIGTGPTAETLYSLGTAISAGISRPPGTSPCDEGGICGVPGLIAVAQTRDGSIENLEAIRSGDIESALVHADMAYWAYHGGGVFRDSVPMRDLRIIANLTAVSLHIVVPEESDIQSISDLRGRRVSLGAEGSGTVGNIRLLLRSRGIGISEVEPSFLKPGPAADALAAGHIDAFFEIGGEPVDAIAQLARQRPIRLLKLDTNDVRQVISLYPFFDLGPIPADIYRNVPETPTLKLGVSWVVREAVEPALVRAITKALWQGTSRELFLSTNPDSHFPTPQDAVVGIGVPFHEGAVNYYRTQNLM